MRYDQSQSDDDPRVHSTMLHRREAINPLHGLTDIYLSDMCSLLLAINFKIHLSEDRQVSALPSKSRYPFSSLATS